MGILCRPIFGRLFNQFIIDDEEDKDSTRTHTHPGEGTEMISLQSFIHFRENAMRRGGKKFYLYPSGNRIQSRRN